MRWTTEEDIQLFKQVNKRLGRTGNVQWHGMRRINGRSRDAMSCRWAVIKLDSVWDGRQWKNNAIQSEINAIESEIERQEKVSVIKTSSPVNTQDSREISASEKPISKPKKVSKSIKERKSFLWGAIKIERYE